MSLEIFSINILGFLGIWDLRVISNNIFGLLILRTSEILKIHKKCLLSKPRFNLGWTTRIWLCSRQGFFSPNHLSNRATCWNSHPILGKKNVHKIHQQRCQALPLGWKEIIFCVAKGDERGIIGYPASNPLILQLNWSEMSTWFPPFYTLSGIQEYQITQNPRIPIPESHITQNPRIPENLES